MVGCAILLFNTKIEQFNFETVGPVAVSGGEYEAVVCQRGLWCAMVGDGGAKGVEHDGASDAMVCGGADDES